MIFIRLYDDPLAQASYLIGCSATGEAVVIDPNRQVEQYLAAAQSRGLTITAVTETHIHADFVSGSRELAQRTGASLYLSACGPPEWQYEYRGEKNVRLLENGGSIRIGQVELAAVHTPGHTPEHLSFLVTDHAVADEPMGIVTGDFVFAGDVGRPDLLEKTANVSGSADAGARQLFRSLAWFKTLPDHLQVWPGHGAGSACGKGLSAMPQSTVGYERRFNWALCIEEEAEFAREVLQGQPEPPGYFREMKRVNRAGPALLGAIVLPPLITVDRLRAVLDSGASLVDTRAAAAFAAGHLPGALSIPYGKSFPTWAGSLIPYDQDLYLLPDPDRPDQLGQIVRTLAMIGFDRITGYFDSAAMIAWQRAGGALAQIEQLSVSSAHQEGSGRLLLDVRAGSEWEAGHIPGATHIPLAELTGRLDELPRDRPIAVHCQGGGRSAVAASLLASRGFQNVANITGGFGAWVAAGLPQREGDEA